MGRCSRPLRRFIAIDSDTGFIKDMERHAPAWLLQVPDMLDAMLFERVKSMAEGTAPERMMREFCQLVTALAREKTADHRGRGFTLGRCLDCRSARFACRTWRFTVDDSGNLSARRCRHLQSKPAQHGQGAEGPWPVPGAVAGTC